MHSATLEILNFVVIHFQEIAQLGKNLTIGHQLEQLKRTLIIPTSTLVWELDLQLVFGQFMEFSSPTGPGGMLISDSSMT